MKLRRPCEHGRYEDHAVFVVHAPIWSDDSHYEMCPGGEFLAEDTLVIPRDADGNWPSFLLDVIGEFGDPWTIQEAFEAALTVREGEE